MMDSWRQVFKKRQSLRQFDFLAETIFNGRFQDTYKHSPL
jgi:hypothetical protein